jgi:hypothetical protein
MHRRPVGIAGYKEQSQLESETNSMTYAQRGFTQVLQICIIGGYWAWQPYELSSFCKDTAI